MSRNSYNFSPGLKQVIPNPAGKTQNNIRLVDVRSEARDIYKTNWGSQPEFGMKPWTTQEESPCYVAEAIALIS